MTQTRICAVCGGASYEGLNIGGKHICTRCERHMVTAQPGTHEYECLLSALGGIRLPMEMMTRAQEDELEAALDQYEPMSVDELLERVGLRAQGEGPDAAEHDAHAGRQKQQADARGGAQ